MSPILLHACLLLLITDKESTEYVIVCDKAVKINIGDIRYMCSLNRCTFFFFFLRTRKKFRYQWKSERRE